MQCEKSRASQARHHRGTFYHDQDPSISLECYQKSIQLRMESLNCCAQTDHQAANSLREVVDDDALTYIQLLEKSLHSMSRCLEKKKAIQATHLEMDPFLYGIHVFSKPIRATPNNEEEMCVNWGDQFSAVTVFNMTLLTLASQCFEETTELLKICLKLVERAICAGVSCSHLSEMNVMTVTNLGFISYKSGWYAEAALYFENATEHLHDDIDRMKNFAGTQHIIHSKSNQFFHAVLHLACAYDASGRHDEAMGLVLEAQLFVGALNVYSQREGIDSSLDLFGLSCTEAIIHLHQKQYDLSMSKFQSLHDAHWESLSLGRRAVILHGIGQVSFEKRDLRETMMHQLAALTIIERIFGENHSVVAEILYTLGIILHDQDEYTDALEVYKRALNVQRKIFGTNHFNSLKTLCNIARVHEASGEDAEALSACSEALQVGEAMLGPKNLLVVEMLVMQGKLLYRLGSAESAMATFNKVIRMIESSQFEAEDMFAHFNISFSPIGVSGASAA
eukprot:CAMPEP_0183297688 /NCGR_PEP_ID=MMETSP0160_2-20130417/4910_1 /TAXON_ID=2839 ORGANISM="Odontella Sinensis, Strain Grunow 1884" /NCGR_SAMPLE_ID=MMETSP0160_2 /ASSEMBLY_ACC=CAM_ASM_000250 /LENGTH=506 /DNA_ID=CAMNT_0025459557 /DNA_START=73 /DNA_END=1593 /DNA_ORIENTATION=+